MGVPLNVLSYGENHYKPGDAYFKSVHAEDHAIRKLPPLPRKKRSVKIDLLVVRVSKSGVVGNSKPCLHCIELLATALPKRGYVLSKVYFSNDKGDIEMCKFSELVHSENKHISRFYKENLQKNMNNK